MLCVPCKPNSVYSRVAQNRRRWLGPGTMVSFKTVTIISSITKYYDAKPAVRNMNLFVTAGETYALNRS